MIYQSVIAQCSTSSTVQYMHAVHIACSRPRRLQRAQKLRASARGRTVSRHLKTFVRIRNSFCIEPFYHFQLCPALNWIVLLTATMVWSIFHNNESVRWNVWKKLFDSPLLKPFSCHLIMVVTWNRLTKHDML